MNTQIRGNRMAEFASILCGVLSFTLAAATLTGDTSVTTLDPTGYSAESAVTLTYTSDSDVSYAGVISGPITFVKKGMGKLTLSSKWTHTGGTMIETGCIAAPDSSYYCGSGAVVTLAGGGVAQTAAGTWARALLVKPGCEGCIDIATGLSVSLNFSTYLTFSNATLRLTGPGTLYGTTTPVAAKCEGGTIVVESGSFQHGDNLLGYAYQQPRGFSVEFHEGTATLVEGTRQMVLPANTVMRGAAIYARGMIGVMSASVTDFIAKDTVVLGERVTVEPSASPSYITNTLAVALAGGTAQTAFFVKSGATLVVSSPLVMGRKGNGSPGIRRSGQGFTKYGAGELVLNGPVDVDGTITVAEGTLTLSRRTYASMAARLDVLRGATVRLDDGTLVASTLVRTAPDPLLEQAEIWFDATRINAEDGATVPFVPNLGTCGGTFHEFVLPEGSACQKAALPPTYSVSSLNGHPALVFNGSQALNLNTYTNNGLGLTVFIVYKWNSYSDTAGLGNGGSPFHLSYLDPANHGSYDGGTSNHGLWLYHEKIANGYPACYRSEVGSQRYTLNWSGMLGGDLSDRLIPVVVSHRRRDALNQGYVFYGAGVNDAYHTGTSGYSASHDIQNVCLGGRLIYDGSPFYYWGSSKINRMFLGQIGEFIVFSRGLSDAERTYIHTYLRRKWLGATDAMPSLPALEVAAATATNLVVDVPASARATLAVDGSAADDASGLLVKNGAGTLAYASVAAPVDAVETAAGTLEMSDAGASSLAAIWIDPSDASTVTTSDADGTLRVTAIRNKGSAGGKFTRNPYSRDGCQAPCPPYNTTGINGLATIGFDRYSALATAAYTNRNFETRQIFIYGVFRRNEFADSNGKGKGGAPFSMTCRNEDTYDVLTDGTILLQDDEAAKFSLHSLDPAHGNWRIALTPFADGTPFIAVVRHFSPYVAFLTWDPTTATCNMVREQNDTFDPLSVDWVQLGGRIAEGGAAYMSAVMTDGRIDGGNRMWCGDVGEFLVFDRQLSPSDENLLAKYLAKKWFNSGDGSAVPPAFLTGRPSAPSFRSGTALTMADGTVLASAAGPVALGSLSFGGDATLVRAGGADMKFADVTGALTFGGSASLSYSLWPTNTVQLFTYGSLTGPSAWTLNAGRQARRYDVMTDAGGIFLRYKPIGTTIYMR